MIHHLPLLATLLPAVTGILDKLIPDKDARDKAKAEAESALLAALAKADADQLAVNKAEAESGNWFAASWRPSIGYICAAALAYQYLARPLLPWFATVLGADVPPLPGLDGTLTELVFAMLGIGGLRTFEKVRGVAR